MLVVAFAATAVAQAPNSFLYQGRLVDDAGDPIATEVSVVFEIYAAPTGGSNIYNATYDITPDNNGVFTQLLTGINTTVFNGSIRYMQLTVEGDPLMPRQAIASAPYAYSAQNFPDGSVTTAKIADDAVTGAKIADNNIGTSHIANNAVTGAKIAASTITDADIFDEPGIASGHYAYPSARIALTSTDINLDSAVITVPSSGYIVVIATAYYDPNHTNGTLDLARFCINTTSATISYYNMVNISTPANAETATDLPIPVCLHAVYNVGSSGTYRYYFVADSWSGSPGVTKARIVAMFFPTAYGVVDTKTPSDYDGPPLDPTVSHGGYNDTAVEE